MRAAIGGKKRLLACDHACARAHTSLHATLRTKPRTADMKAEGKEWTNQS